MYQITPQDFGAYISPSWHGAESQSGAPGQHGSGGLENKNVWFGTDLLVKSILVTKQQPRNHSWGPTVSPALHGGPCAGICQTGCKMKSPPRLRGAGRCVGGDGTYCQQQELFIFRGPWRRDSDSWKPQAKCLNGNLRSKQHLRHCGFLAGWNKLSYKQSIGHAAAQ